MKCLPYVRRELNMIRENVSVTASFSTEKKDTSRFILGMSSDATPYQVKKQEVMYTSLYNIWEIKKFLPTNKLMLNMYYLLT